MKAEVPLCCICRLRSLWLGNWLCPEDLVVPTPSERGPVEHVEEMEATDGVPSKGRRDVTASLTSMLFRHEQVSHAQHAAQEAIAKHQLS